MPKLTKKEVAVRIVAAFPESGFEAETLIEGNTLDGLLSLESELQAKGQPELKAVPSADGIELPDAIDEVDIEMSAIDTEDVELYELAPGLEALEFYNFSLLKGEKKPLPKRVHGLIIERLSKGHIVPAKRG